MDFQKFKQEMAKAQNNALVIPEVIIASPELKSAFIRAYNELTGTLFGESAYINEALQFASLINSDNLLQRCNAYDLGICFLNCIMNGGSFDSSKNLNYLFTTAVRDANKQVIGYKPDLRNAPNGEIATRMQLGQILHTDLPVVVYNCDYYRVQEKGELNIVQHQARTPRPADAKVIAGFIAVTRYDNSRFYACFDLQDFEYWRNKSKAPNSPAWGGGVMEKAVPMILSKIRKHAVKHIPLTNVSAVNRKAKIVDYEPNELTESQLSEEAQTLKDYYEYLCQISGAFTPEEIVRFKSFEDLGGDYSEVENIEAKVKAYYEKLVSMLSEEKQGKCPQFSELKNIHGTIQKLEEVNHEKLKKPF